MGRREVLSDFDKGQIIAARRLGRRLPVSIGKYLLTVVQGGTKTQTRDRLLGAQDSSMDKGNGGYPIWSKPKKKNILMIVTAGMCHGTKRIARRCLCRS